MGLYEELLAELTRAAAAPSSDLDAAPERAGRLQELEREVAALRRAVARLAELVAQPEEDRPPAEVIRRQLLDEAQGLLAPAPEEPPPPVFEGSPYRGAVNFGPGRAGAERCRRCHKPLEADDPDLEGEEGRICMGCFQRGDA